MLTVTAQGGPWSNSASYKILTETIKISPWVPKFTKVAARDLLKKKLCILFLPSMITKIKEQVPESDSLVPGGDI